MLDCRLCLWHCVRAVLKDIPSRHAPELTHKTLRVPSFPYKRYSSGVARVGSISFQTDAAATGKDAWKNSKQNKTRKEKEKRETRRLTSKPPLGVAGRQVRLEFQYLKDPLELGNRVRTVLREGDTEKAYEMVRQASKGMDCTVAWNHVLDYEMSRSRVSYALKAYNEMKKRAQLPDSHTFVLLFRGLADHAHFGASLGKALSLYHSMDAPNSPVKPSIMHTNAVLKVCARANDMDALWGVASKIPQSGPGAADATTFTTILNAIRHSVVVNVARDLTPDQLASRRAQAILDGRRIWEDIVTRWRQGNILVDEGLVCAMGRLLLIGLRPGDWDDVLSMLAQAMNIPRLIPRLGTKSRSGEHIPSPRLANTSDELTEEGEQFTAVQQSGAGNDRFRPGGEFDPLDAGKAAFEARGKSKPALAYARPGNNTLSLVLEACLKMVSKSAATDYWTLLTDATSHGIQPDAENIHAYLRNLRLSRASRDAVEIVQTYFSPAEPDSKPLPPAGKTFRIAMSACVRDKNNPHALSHAIALMELMIRVLPDPDSVAMLQYLQVVHFWPSSEDVVRALDCVAPAAANLRSLMLYGSADNKGRSGIEMRPEDRALAVQALKELYTCYIRIINGAEMPQERMPHFKRQAGILEAFLDREQTKETKRQNSFFVDEKEVGQDEEVYDGEMKEMAHRRGMREQVRRRGSRESVEDRYRGTPRQPEIRDRGLGVRTRPRKPSYRD